MSLELPLMTSKLAHQIEACCNAFSVERLEGLHSLTGNPYNVQSQSFGKVTAFLAQGTSNSMLFNRVVNLDSDDLPHLDFIIEWYRSQNVNCSFDVIPSHAQPELLRGLASKGFYQSGFYTTLYGLPHAASMIHSRSITIRPVSLRERNTFAEIYLEGFDIQKADEISYLRDSYSQLVGRPGVHCLFALVDGIVAAIAILFVYQNIGYLALAVTLPAFRGLGCQKVLLQERMELASTEGCTLVVGQAEFASISQRNMEKTGLRVAYTKALWIANDF